jgi:aspartate racemase
LLPRLEERVAIHRIIFEELCQGRVNATDKAYLEKVLDYQEALGTQGVILGCTELPLLLTPTDSALPLFNTTALHAQAAVDFALAGETA